MPGRGRGGIIGEKEKTFFTASPRGQSLVLLNYRRMKGYKKERAYQRGEEGALQWDCCTGSAHAMVHLKTKNPVGHP